MKHVSHNTIHRTHNTTTEAVFPVTRSCPLRASYIVVRDMWSVCRERGGFTMVELLVSISLFSIIVSIAIGGLANVIRTQRQLSALIAANSNVSFALEQIAREVRTGSGFSVSDNELDFTNAAGQSVAYKVTAGKVEKGTAFEGVLQFQPITGDNAVVQYLNFFLSGDLAGDGYPPRITITIGISPPGNIVGASQIISRIETTVSARQLDT